MRFMTSSKSQYETIFKKWGFRKNRDAETWRTLLDDTGSSLKRKVEDIYDGQELIPAAKVRKAKTRYRLNTIQGKDSGNIIVVDYTEYCRVHKRSS